MLNCPNCGAPIQKDICPYCGSVFLDWASFDVRRPTFVKVKNHYGHIVLLKLIPKAISMRHECEPTCLYADDRIVNLRSMETITIEAEFEAVTFREKLSNREVLMIDIDPEVADEDAKRRILSGIKEAAE